MNSPPSSLRQTVLDRFRSGPPQKVWTPADFLDAGTRDAVDKVLQRLVMSDEIRRIERGLYDRPGQNSLTGQRSPPDPRHVIDAVVRRDQIRVLVDGMTAANDLGLTNAVPAKVVVHTDARLRPIHLGKLDISFRPTAASKLYWAGRPAMRLVQALHWLRDTLSDNDEGMTIRPKLTRLLWDGPGAEQLRADLSVGLGTLPAWMQDLLKPLLMAEPAS